VKEKDLYDVFKLQMESAQRSYDYLIKQGVPQEDARSVIPQSATCNLVLTVNLRALLDFYSKRRKGKGAQQEITVLAEQLKEKVVSVEPWTTAFFGSDSK
jgi:thymidylate synthase (FAD)